MSPGTAVTAVGGSGTVSGLTGSETAGGPVPAADVAATENVYVTPLVRLSNTNGPGPLIVAPPGLAVAVYPVTGLPQVSDGLTDTVTVASPAVVETKGASGRPRTSATPPW